ncbi:hypothetical protein BpHYR1_023167 [Brachionus plicatilis]|uniref:Uncharacterized protein n=1 Tax=Brachionus plicatilis TaxID=10195 RepID=A0A3M7QHG7_BRAPC|nr:hypothetical protein BpHYR1_023167 [Brachionus plicatilis]
MNILSVSKKHVTEWTRTKKITIKVNNLDRVIKTEAAAGRMSHDLIELKELLEIIFQNSIKI